jgi:nucleoside-diphosphate-sugar epimerase
MRVVVIGASGFVGSAFCRLLATQPGVELIAINRSNYAQHRGQPSDLVIEAACNSKKFLADQDPVAEFDASVTHRLRTLQDFPAPLHVHLSSVDVYSDLTSPANTREDSPIDLSTTSRYGLHKLLAEQLVRGYASRWLILRLAGMVGPNLRKNPVYDLLNGQPLRIHPDSQYQFLHTDDVAATAWELIQRGLSAQIFNLAGDGLISPREIAALANREMNLSLLPPNASPRIVNATIDKAKQLIAVPTTRTCVERFLRESGAIAPRS